MFAIGFAAGSVVTFIILAIFGFMQSDNFPHQQRDRNELERYYWIGYKQGVEDEKATSQTIGQLPISKN
jgi:hypothetical protein